MVPLRNPSSLISYLKCIFALHEPFSGITAESWLFLHFLGKPVKKTDLTSIHEDGHLSHLGKK